MIICNATPLIAFARIQRLDILQQTVGTLVIPEGVAKEVRGYRGGYYAEIILDDEPWITVQALRAPAQVQLLLPVLDQGEAEVITLALEQNADLVLIDELTGRKVAQSLQLQVIGTVGILIRAKQMGIIPAVKPILEKMIQRGIRYSQRFVCSILHATGEE
jgi:predicted nucleic acid-binding protein